MADRSLADRLTKLWDNRDFFESMPTTMKVELRHQTDIMGARSGSLEGQVKHIESEIEGKGDDEYPNVFRIVIHSNGLSYALRVSTLNEAVRFDRHGSANPMSGTAVESVEVQTLRGETHV